jgi:gluconate 2-dehydrogenase
MSPKIFNSVALEPEFEAHLKSGGDVQSFDATAGVSVVAAAVRGANAMLVRPGVPIGEELLAGTPDLKVIATTAVGYNTFDVDLLTKHGVALCNTPIVLNDSVADLTMAMLLMLTRGLMGFEQYSRGGAWGRREPQPALAHDPDGKTLGIVGFGRIGKEVARRAQAFKLKVIWHDVFGEAPAGSPAGEYRPLDDLLREADFVTLHTDLNPTSRRLIGERELSLMRPDAYLINTSRGPVVDQKALTAALQANAIAGAALDVLENEPPDPDDAIVKLPNVITFPHIGTATEETRKAMRGMSVDNLLAVLAGKEPRACVNPEVLGRG